MIPPLDDAEYVGTPGVEVIDTESDQGPQKSLPTQHPLSQAQRQKERRLKRIAEVEDQVLETAQQIVEATLAFSEVEPEQQLPPEDWVERYGETGAIQRLRVARAAWLPAAKVPYGMRVAPAVMVGIAKARGQSAQLINRTAEVNVKIAMPAPTTAEHPGLVKYESKEIE